VHRILGYTIMNILEKLTSVVSSITLYVSHAPFFLNAHILVTTRTALFGLAPPPDFFKPSGYPTYSKELDA